MATKRTRRSRRTTSAAASSGGGYTRTVTFHSQVRKPKARAGKVRKARVRF